jgi:hypothetical protein
MWWVGGARLRSVDLAPQAEYQFNVADRLPGGPGDYLGRGSRFRQRPNRGMAFLESISVDIAIV